MKHSLTKTGLMHPSDVSYRVIMDPDIIFLPPPTPTQKNKKKHTHTHTHTHTQSNESRIIMKNGLSHTENLKLMKRFSQS